ncbi:MAG TPA: fumarylacetoacetate hydrolase family protein [Burkholderiales bacterium]|nr:fumarylacetoacetate hydrolase family protein [Burkholderiales bacterium]
MKLCRYGPGGHEKPGIIDSNGKLRDLSLIIDEIGPGRLEPRKLRALAAAVKVEALPLVEGHPRFGVPFTGTGSYIGIGLNYSDHAKEADLPIPDEPIIFNKATTSICGPYDDIVQPKNSKMLDWECELAVVIGARAQYVSEDDALKYVAGYCIANDVSERGFQFQSTQWKKGKSHDSFGPLGPWLVTTDEIPDPQALEMWLDVNGERMQKGTTRTMIFPVKKLVSYVSEYLTLLPGDVIATGTPPGVGMGIKPAPVYLKPGDVVTLSISGLGEQRQKVVPFPGP